MHIPILFEDEYIVVVDKPRGMVSNRAQTVRGETVQDWMAGRITNEKVGYFGERSGLVHRLDKETSGVMVLAKTPVSFDELLRQFKEREVTKTYHALTHGCWTSREGTINLAVGRRRDDRQKMGVREDGRESVTGYRVREEWKSWKFPEELGVQDKGYGGFALVEFNPRTGRMHQIRVHARQMGHPVVGDTLYAGRKRSREDVKWTGGLMLLARTLELTHPVTRERVKYESKIDLLGPVRQFLT